MSQFVEERGRNGVTVHTLDYRGRLGGVVVAVQTFGQSWGYTIWEGDRCLFGEKNWNWTLDDAKERSIARVQNLCGPTAEERAG